MKQVGERVTTGIIIVSAAIAIIVPSPKERFAAKEIEIETEPTITIQAETTLREEVESYISNVCRFYGIDKDIVLAIIEQESGWNEQAVGDSGESYGLMQIQPKWHEERIARLEVTDLLNPFQNVTVGIDILSEKLNAGLGIEWALMAYNGGNAYAYDMIAKGQVSDYAISVMDKIEVLKSE